MPLELGPHTVERRLFTVKYTVFVLLRNRKAIRVALIFRHYWLTNQNKQKTIVVINFRFRINQTLMTYKQLLMTLTNISDKVMNKSKGVVPLSF